MPRRITRAAAAAAAAAPSPLCEIVADVDLSAVLFALLGVRHVISVRAACRAWREHVARWAQARHGALMAHVDWSRIDTSTANLNRIVSGNGGVAAWREEYAKLDTYLDDGVCVVHDTWGIGRNKVHCDDGSGHGWSILGTTTHGRFLAFNTSQYPYDVDEDGDDDAPAPFELPPSADFSFALPASRVSFNLLLDDPYLQGVGQGRSHPRIDLSVFGPDRSINVRLSLDGMDVNHLINSQRRGQPYWPCCWLQLRIMDYPANTANLPWRPGHCPPPRKHYIEATIRNTHLNSAIGGVRIARGGGQGAGANSMAAIGVEELRIFF